MKGKIAVVTGGSSGIGLETARQLAERECRVLITGRDRDKLGKAVLELGELAEGVPCDLSTLEGCLAMIQDTTARLDGSLDYLVHSAGSYHQRSIMEEDPETAGETFFTNFFSAVNMARAFYPLLKAGNGKSIAFISSTLSQKPIEGSAIYSASKAALDSLVSSLALEWAESGIRVNSVLPGVVDTPIHESKYPSELTRDEKMRQFAALHPLGRVGDPGDIARTVLFLLSSDAAWITGVKWPVDGGISLV
jgi:NAD(P)-dependent dehydrogenase (short-subunit alcohol dehydrogenase family)